MDLGVPVIALSQLNRAVTTRESKRPTMADLRDSGDVEQDADIVMLLHRPEYYLQDRTPPDLEGVAEVLVEKHRNGATGTVRMRFDGALTRFDNLAE
jgi:replicative DNA helicase